MQKLPEFFRITITRGTEFLKWTEKLELRKDHFYAVTLGFFQINERMETGFEGRMIEEMEKTPQKVKDVKVSKDIFLQFGRCFKCLAKGGRARDCKSIESIEFCNNFGQSVTARSDK